MKTLLKVAISYKDAVKRLAKVTGKSVDDIKGMSEDEISKLKKRLAFKFHPDRGGNENKYKEINEAIDRTQSGPKFGFDPFSTKNKWKRNKSKEKDFNQRGKKRYEQKKRYKKRENKYQQKKEKHDKKYKRHKKKYQQEKERYERDRKRRKERRERQAKRREKRKKRAKERRERRRKDRKERRRKEKERDERLLYGAALATTAPVALAGAVGDFHGEEGRQTKRMSKGYLTGAGLGTAGGIAKNVLQDKKRDMLTDAMGGATLGAALGTAGGYGYHKAKEQ